MCLLMLRWSIQFLQYLTHSVASPDCGISLSGSIFHKTIYTTNPGHPFFPALITKPIIFTSFIACYPFYTTSAPITLNYLYCPHAIFQPSCCVLNTSAKNFNFPHPTAFTTTFTFISSKKHVSCLSAPPKDCNISSTLP